MVQISCPFYLSSSITYSNVFPPLLNFHWYRKAESSRLCIEPQGSASQWTGYPTRKGHCTQHGARRCPYPQHTPQAPSAVPRTGDIQTALAAAAASRADTCAHVPAQGPILPPGPARALAPATAAGTGPQPWKLFPFATHKSAGRDLSHPSSSRGNRRNCCFLVPCKHQGGGTQDILPNISGLIFF